jgi:hypothetical protein
MSSGPKKAGSRFLERPMTENVQTHGFQAEVRELLRLMIHSLYSHREIFLRS